MLAHHVTTPKLVTTGGNVSTFSSGAITYAVHTFKLAETGTKFMLYNGKGDAQTTTNDTLAVEYLVIAGGGGGGSQSGGGAGAGGYRTNVSGQTTGGGGSAEAAMALPAGTYTITVGAGGAGEPDNSPTAD